MVDDSRNLENEMRTSLPVSAVAATVALLHAFPPSLIAGEHPLSEDARLKLSEELQGEIKTLDLALKEAPDRIGLYSRRADAHFFLGHFDKSVTDYEKMVELDAAQGPPHWRRGIARFYAKKFPAAAKQFEEYHTFDNVDRENGIWRYFSQYRAYGRKKAQAGLLKYEKTDREPFPSVYRLFSGDLTPKEVLKLIDDADISDDEREKRHFYAHLYIGLNHALEDRDKAAIEHLAKSTANRWGPRAGYGPQYMWHVGRLHYDLLISKAKKTDKTDAKPK